MTGSPTVALLGMNAVRVDGEPVDGDRCWAVVGGYVPRWIREALADLVAATACACLTVGGRSHVMLRALSLWR